jgi:tRNA(Arg) A34 adenosine deaminase TadA
MNDFDLRHLRSAIDLARQARERGNHPFGALLVDQTGAVLLRAENTVVTGQDITGHAETNLMREASTRFPPKTLALCTLYASTEPCAMCAGAIHWGGVGRVVFALSQSELYDMVGPSPRHLLLPCRDVFARTTNPIEVIGPSFELDADARAVHVGFWTRRDEF